MTDEQFDQLIAANMAVVEKLNAEIETQATLITQRGLIEQMAQDAATQFLEIEMLRQQLRIVAQENAVLHQTASELNAQIVALKQERRSND